MGLLRAVRRIKERTSAVLLQSGLDENWWADSMECKNLSAKLGRHPMKGDTEYHLTVQISRLEQ